MDPGGAGKSVPLGGLVELATLTGVAFDTLADFDDGQLSQVRDSAEAEARWRAWTNDTELLALILDQLRHLTALVARGLLVQPVKRVGRGALDIKPTERPEWVAKPKSDEVVVGPSDFFSMMRR